MLLKVISCYSKIFHVIQSSRKLLKVIVKYRKLFKVIERNWKLSNVIESYLELLKVFKTYYKFRWDIFCVIFNHCDILFLKIMACNKGSILLLILLHDLLLRCRFMHAKCYTQSKVSHPSKTKVRLNPHTVAKV